MFSLLNSIQVLGIRVNGSLSISEVRAKGAVNSSLFLSTRWKSSFLRSALGCQQLEKESGRKPCMNCCMN